MDVEVYLQIKHNVESKNVEEREKNGVVYGRKKITDYIVQEPFRFLTLEPSPRGRVKNPDIDTKNLIDINMMPFVLGDINTLPSYLHKYSYHINKSSANVNYNLLGKVAYLTIQESFVEKGNTQRRPGLHTDATKILIKDQNFNTASTISWGGGPYGGIIIWSDVPETTKIYNCIVKDEHIGEGGDLGYMREIIEESDNSITNLGGELIYITDHTPHEALPMKESGYRRFFRLVFGEIDVWYAQHSTPNPLGFTPAKTTKILYENKFT